MKALVTGGGGFLGSHLVDRLQADGHDVFVARRADYDLTREDDRSSLLLRHSATIAQRIATLRFLVARLVTGSPSFLRW